MARKSKSTKSTKTTKNTKNNQKSTNQCKSRDSTLAVSITNLAEKLNDTESNQQFNSVDKQNEHSEQIEQIEQSNTDDSSDDSSAEDSIKITSYKSKKSNKSTKSTKATKSDIETAVSNDDSVQQVVVKPKGKLTLTSMHVVATWEYDVDNQECTLCHRDLMTPIPVTNTNINGQTNNNKPRYENDVSVGTCRHGYHVSCINSWVKNGNNSCPKCKTPWKTDKNVSSSVYVYPSSS